MAKNSSIPEASRASDTATGSRPIWAQEHAANEIFPAPRLPDGGDPARRDTPETPRLAGFVLASLMLHLGIALLVSSSLTYTAVREAASPSLTVTLAQTSIHNLQPAHLLPPATTTDLPTEPQIQRDTLGPSQQPARFLIDPDLSVLEQIPTSIPGAISLRLYVTAQGVVDRVSVVRADPVPKELIDGLVERFGKAKFTPALIGSQPAASTVEVTIRVDPPAQLINIGQ